MGFVGFYFFILFAVMFLFLWVNLTNFRLTAARVLALNAFFFLLWIFAKLMLVSGIGWESIRFWMAIMVVSAWFLPASITHLVIELRRTLPGRMFYATGVTLTYLIPVLMTLTFLLFPSLLPHKYVAIGQWIWDGILPTPIMWLHTGYIVLSLITSLILLATFRFPLIDAVLLTFSFGAFFLRTLLMTFDVATYWHGWFFWQPLLALLSYLSLWLLYRKNFWLEESFSFVALEKLLKYFSLPILIVKNNRTLWYMNEAMKKLLPADLVVRKALALDDLGSLITNSEEFFDMLSVLSPENPSTYRLLTITTDGTTQSFYTHGEVILLSRRIVVGYAFTLTPLESDTLIQLAQKHVTLHKKLEEIHRVYKNIFQSIDTPMVLVDSTGALTGINPAACKLLGLNPDLITLEGEHLPFPRTVLSRILTTSQTQRIIHEIDFGEREWQKLHCQKKNQAILGFFVKKIEPFFLLILEDISPASEEKGVEFDAHFYRQIHALSLEILESDTPVWDAILNTFMEIFPHSGYVVALSEITDNEIVSPRAIRGVSPEILEKINNLLGHPVFVESLRIPAHFSLEKNIMLSGRLNKITGGIQELFFYSLNPMIAMIIEHMLGIGDIYGLGLTNGQTLYGLLVIMVKKGYTFPSLEWLEVFASEVSRVLEIKHTRRAD